MPRDWGKAIGRENEAFPSPALSAPPGPALGVPLCQEFPPSSGQFLLYLYRAKK